MISTILACFFAGAWLHSLLVQNGLRQEISRLKRELWFNKVDP